MLFVLLVLISSGAVNVMSGSGGSGLGLGSGEDSLENVTLTCAERNLRTSNKTQYSTVTTIAIRSFMIVYFSTLFLLGISLNCFVIWLVATHKKLHTLSFGVALQVIVLNVMFSVFIFLPVLITSIAGRWVLGKEGCVLTGFMGLIAAFLRTSFMFIFVVDRFLSVLFPFFYPRHDIKIAVTLSVFSWLFMLGLSTINLPGILDSYTFIKFFNFCKASSTCNRGCSTLSNIYFSVVILPCTIIYP